MSQGADRVYLFFDNPDDPAMAVLSQNHRVTCTPCTDAFWVDLGLDRSARFTKRQNAVLTRAYHSLADGWLLNVDADEFLYFADQTLAQAVDQFDPQDNAICVMTAEAIGSDGSGSQHDFRLPMGRLQAREVYQSDAGLFARRSGFVGHDTGKSLTRAGQPGMRLRQHWAEQDGVGRVPGPLIKADQGAYLLHFIDAGYDRWRAKVDWRLRSSGFDPRIKTRIETLLAGEDPEGGLKDLYQILHGCDAARLDRLKRLNKHVSVAIDFDEIAASVFPTRTET